MKTIVIFVSILLFGQLLIAQNKGIKPNQLFIKNITTGKSVKLFSSVETLKDFGELKEIKNSEIDTTESDYAKRYIYDGVIIYVSGRGMISSFDISSPNISLEKEGKFAISVGNSMQEIAKIFPDEVKTAHLNTFGQKNKEYLLVEIPCLYYNQFLKEDVIADNALFLFFNPENKNLEKIYFWIRP